jgi:hypothetical protein
MIPFAILLLACAIAAELYGLAVCIAASAAFYLGSSRQVILDNSRGKK